MWAAVVAWLVAQRSSQLVSTEADLGICICLLTFAGGLVLAMSARSRRAHVGVEEQYASRLRCLVTQWQEASLRDSLTGLYNHGYLLGRLDEEVARAERYKRPLSVVILDLSGFKLVNDRYGHLEGDKILIAVSQALRGQSRQGDVLARYGGDEFCILLPETKGEETHTVVRRFEDAFGELAADPAQQRRGLSLGFEYGCATYPEDGESPRALLAAADSRLYREKVLRKAAEDARGRQVTEGLFHRLAGVLAASLDPEERIAACSRAIMTSLSLRGCFLRQWRENSIRFSAFASQDPADPQTFSKSIRERPLGPEDGPGATAAKERRVITSLNVRDDARVAEQFRALAEPDLWVQWIPVLVGDEVEGVLTMYGLAGEAEPPPPALSRSIGRLLGSGIQSADAYVEASRHRDQLAALTDVAGALLQEGPLDGRMEEVAARIAQVAGYDGVTLDTYDPTGQLPYLRCAYSSGPIQLLKKWREVRPPFDSGIVREFFAALKEPYLIQDLSKEEAISFEEREVLGAGGLVSAAVVPLRFQDELLGLLGVSSTEPGAFDEADLTVVSAIANEVAPVIKVAMLHTELTESHLGAIVRLSHAAEARDPFTGEHLRRIRAYCEAIGQRLGLSEEDQKALGLTSVMHDLGKLRIPDSILLKAGELSEDDWQTMKLHPVYGEQILGTGSFYETARQVVRSHHECWNGTGYPDGLKGHEIPMFARIVTVADAFDALTSRRPYKDAEPAELALEYILAERGRKFDPEVVDAFKALWDAGMIRNILQASPPAYSDHQEKGSDAAA